MTTKLTRLGTPETLSAFGELFTLVYNNGMQQSAILMPKIQGLSEKAQNQIYGRFYQASHPLEKDPVKGRELLAKNGDFIGLASKFLEVKTDIEHSAKIYKLFQENAPIKTILSSYKKLSSASRKEIEEHLGMVAAEAAPKALETALVKVFDGMGAYNADATANTSSSSASSSSSADAARKNIKNAILGVAHAIKQDLDLANQNADLISPKDPSQAMTKKQVEHLRELSAKFSKAVKIAIEHTLECYLDAADPRLLREHIHHFFTTCVGSSVNFKTMFQNVELTEKDTNTLSTYYKVAQDFYDVLPRFTPKQPMFSEMRFAKMAKAHYSTLPETSLKAYDQLALDSRALKSKEAQLALHQENPDVMKRLNVILDPANNKGLSYQAYAKLPGVVTDELNRHLPKGIQFAQATKEQMKQACIAYVQARVTTWYTNQMKREAFTDVVQALAPKFLADFKILKQNEDFFKSKGAAEDQAKLLEIFDSLSPYAQLLIEQEFIQLNSLDLPDEKTRADTMRVLIAQEPVALVKPAMVRTFMHFSSNTFASTILEQMEPALIGTAERLALETYLGLPRYLAFNFFKEHPKGSEGDLARSISMAMECYDPGMLPQFGDLLGKAENLIALHVKKFIEEQGSALDNLSSTQAAATLTQFLIMNNLYAKKDFINKVTKFDEMLASILLHEESEGIGAPKDTAAATAKANPAKSAQAILTDEAVDRVVSLATDYHNDFFILQTAAQDGMDCFVLFEGLSPYAKLLIEQKLLATQPNETLSMQETLEQATPDTLKKAMQSLLYSFGARASTRSIFSDIKVEKLGTMEKQLLLLYLGLPRDLVVDCLLTTPECSLTQCKKVVSERMSKENQALLERNLVLDFKSNLGFLVEQLQSEEQKMATVMAEDYATLHELTEYLNESGFFPAKFTSIYETFSDHSKVIFECILHKEPRVTLDTATWPNLKAACEKLLPELKREWLEGKKRLFSKSDFLEIVFSSLPKTT